MQFFFFYCFGASISSFLDNHNFGTNCFAFYFGIYNLLSYFWCFIQIYLIFKVKLVYLRKLAKIHDIFVFMIVLARYLFVTIVFESSFKHHTHGDHNFIVDCFSFYLPLTDVLCDVISCLSTV